MAGGKKKDDKKKSGLILDPVPDWARTMGTPPKPSGLKIDPVPDWARTMGTPPKPSGLKIDPVPDWARTMGTPPKPSGLKDDPVPDWARTMGTPPKKPEPPAYGSKAWEERVADQIFNEYMKGSPQPPVKEEKNPWEEIFSGAFEPEEPHTFGGKTEEQVADEFMRAYIGDWKPPVEELNPWEEVFREAYAEQQAEQQPGGANSTGMGYNVGNGVRKAPVVPRDAVTGKGATTPYGESARPGEYNAGPSAGGGQEAEEENIWLEAIKWALLGPFALTGCADEDAEEETSGPVTVSSQEYDPMNGVWVDSGEAAEPEPDELVVENDWGEKYTKSPDGLTDEERAAGKPVPDEFKGHDKWLDWTEHEVTIAEDGTVEYGDTITYYATRDCLRHCADGALSETVIKEDGGDHQSQTTWERGAPTPADKIPFVVLPIGYPNADKLMGCMAAITNEDGKTVYAIVSDKGLAKNGMGEVSLMASDLLYPGEEHKANAGRDGNVTIAVFPDSKQEDIFDDFYGKYDTPKSVQESDYHLDYSGKTYQEAYDLLAEKLVGIGTIKGNKEGEPLEGVPYDILVSELGLNNDDMWEAFSDKIQEVGAKYKP